MIFSALNTFSILRIVLTGTAAYFAACRIESIWARVFGIAYLCFMAILTLPLALSGNPAAILLCLALTVAALHAWWYTRM